MEESKIELINKIVELSAIKKEIKETIEQMRIIGKENRDSDNYKYHRLLKKKLISEMQEMIYEIDPGTETWLTEL